VEIPAASAPQLSLAGSAIPQKAESIQAKLRQLSALSGIVVLDPGSGSAAAPEAAPAFWVVRPGADGWMRLTTDGYSCVVPVSPEDGARLDAIAWASSDPARVAAFPNVTERITEDERRFVLALIRDRYREALQERCGPPPR
jgi:hypothetical protein